MAGDMQLMYLLDNYGANSPQFKAYAAQKAAAPQDQSGVFSDIIQSAPLIAQVALPFAAAEVGAAYDLSTAGASTAAGTTTAASTPYGAGGLMGTDTSIAGGLPEAAVGAPSSSAVLGDPALAAGSATAGGAAGAGAGGTVGSMNWLQQLGMGTGILGNLTGMYGASQLGKVPGQADPFAPYRGAAAQQLMALQADPSLVTKQPGYEAGLQAVERAGAAEGFTGSGNMMVALSQYGGQAYQQAIQNLMTMSGASQAPATGAQVGATATQDQFSAYTAGLNSLGATMMALGGGAKNPGGGTSSNLLFS